MFLNLENHATSLFLYGASKGSYHLRTLFSPPCFMLFHRYGDEHEISFPFLRDQNMVRTKRLVLSVRRMLVYITHLWIWQSRLVVLSAKSASCQTWIAFHDWKTFLLSYPQLLLNTLPLIDDIFAS